MWRGVRYYCQTKWRRLRNYCYVLQSMHLGTGGDGCRTSPCDDFHLSFNLYGKSSRLGLQRENLRTQKRSLCTGLHGAMSPAMVHRHLTRCTCGGKRGYRRQEKLLHVQTQSHSHGSFFASSPKLPLCLLLIGTQCLISLF